MPVESLAIVGGPMSGLGQNETVIDDAGNWLRQHDIKPLWLAGGAVVGAFVGDQVLRGALVGGALAAGMSWLCARSCKAEAPRLVGVVQPGVGQIEKSGIHGLGQIEKSGIHGLGSVEMTPTNIAGLALAGLVGAFLIFGRD